MKYQLMFLLTIIFINPVVSQTGHIVSQNRMIIEQAVNKACDEMNIDSLNINHFEERVSEYIHSDSLFKILYTAEVSIFTEIPNIEEQFKKYVNWISKTECKKLKEKYSDLDKSYIDNQHVRNAYLKNKSILYSVFEIKSPNELIKYFEVEDIYLLKDHLKLIVSGIIKSSEKTYLTTNKLEGDGIVFSNVLTDYITGSIKLQLYLEFDSLGEKIIKYYYIKGKTHIRVN